MFYFIINWQNAYLSGKFYFDTELERCFLSLNYAGNLDLNKDIPTNITGFRAFSLKIFK